MYEKSWKLSTEWDVTASEKKQLLKNTLMSEAEEAQQKGMNTLTVNPASKVKSTASHLQHISFP